MEKMAFPVGMFNKQLSSLASHDGWRLHELMLYRKSTFKLLLMLIHGDDITYAKILETHLGPL